MTSGPNNSAPFSSDGHEARGHGTTLALENNGAASQRPVPRRVWGSTAWLVSGRLWGSTCTLVMLFLLARHLSGPGFGRFTFYLALFMVLDSLVDMGTGQVAVQRTATAPERIPAVLRVTRRLRLITGTLGVILVGGGAWLANEPGAGWILLASFYPISHTLELSLTVFKNEIAWGRPVAVRAAANGASLAFVLLCYWRGVEEPALFLFAVALGSTLGNLGLHAISRPHLARLPRSSAAQPYGPILRAALPLGIASLCQQTYFYIDNLFVRALVGEAAVGHYNIAVRLMSWAIMVAVFATLAALPWLTREHRAGRLGVATARLAQPLFAVAGLATGIAMVFRTEVLALFGPEFPSAAGALAWLLPASALVYAGSALLTAVVATGQTKAVLAIAASALLVNLAGNALLVPDQGITGAALATCATELVVVLGAALALKRLGTNPFGPGTHPWRWLAGPVLFALAWSAAQALCS
ncbi:MAG: oligosaccharide flippase family protein [Planctomycetota bacterium]|nr:oligosaccharide flippase family protein [Planctomycetota bacterium]